MSVTLSLRFSRSIMLHIAALLIGLISPKSLQVRVGSSGGYHSDGSVEADLPMAQLSELFNVNHFIVSQVIMLTCLNAH